MTNDKLRRDILHDGSARLTYEIREIIRLAREVEAFGVPIIWENIGDPIAKGEKLPDWIKEIIVELVKDDHSYSYSTTQGDPESRAFLADRVNRRGGAQITGDEIIFFNGLGDALSNLFGYLKREARVMGPSPAYSAHSSAESAHSGYPHLTYALDPENNWMPDLEDLRKKVKYNDSIAGLLLINPDNPTGAVYSTDILRELVSIARDHKLFIICDEIYSNIIYSGSNTCMLSNVIDEVPGIAMHGISKEYPWPGARCGWIEVFNRSRYPAFNRYIQTLINAKMLEVSATYLPQLSVPKVMGDERYPQHLQRRKVMFENRADQAFGIFSGIEGTEVIKPQGAFYMTVTFNKGSLKNRQSLPIAKPQLEALVRNKAKEVRLDKRFVYYLLASTGICVVPLTGFATNQHGFRLTLLETDDEKRVRTFERIKTAIQEYLSS